MPTEHEFPDTHVHFKWDVGNEPALSVQSGDSVTVETRDVSDNQLTPSSTSKDLETLDWDRVYPLAGPIEVIREDVAIPIEPFFGTMGVCPSGATNQEVMPPGTFGGNMDTRQLVQGATLYLPVEVEGALFSCGDAHAAQGDGEVCVTGIETPIGATLRFRLEKGRRIPAPQFRTPGPLTPRANRGEWYGTTGVGPDLFPAAQDALRAMIDYVSARSGLSAEDAYVLASLCVDLKISEIVDAGQYVVSALLPLNVFAQE